MDLMRSVGFKNRSLPAGAFTLPAANHVRQDLLLLDFCHDCEACPDTWNYENTEAQRDYVNLPSAKELLSGRAGIYCRCTVASFIGSSLLRLQYIKALLDVYFMKRVSGRVSGFFKFSWPMRWEAEILTKMIFLV
ncbi:uncharacterized protein LOC103792108 isoform X2 [Callithrix jacchus]